MSRKEERGIKMITEEELNERTEDPRVLDITADKIIDMMEKTSKQSDLGDYIKSIIPRLQNIWDHFGELNQYNKMMEEAKEYIESGADEEIVDIFIVAFQHIIARGLIDTLKYKVDRTEDRIKEEYYEVEK